MLGLVDVTWQSILIAYGPLGVLAFFYVKNNESRYRDQKERGDRLEHELSEQNRVMREQVLADLSRATTAASAAVARRTTRGGER